jgi:hypothetical protein
MEERGCGQMPKKREGENFENESIEIMTEDSP